MGRYKQMVNATSPTDMVRISILGEGSVTAPASVWIEWRQIAMETTEGKLADPAACPLAEAVADQVRQRADVGLAKYGVTVDGRTDIDLLGWLQHLQ